MAFRDYKNIAAVLEAFDIRYKEENFVRINKVEIDPRFSEELDFSKNYIDIRASEASICENIIYPVLKESYKKYANTLALWSHKSIFFDDALSGVPDYLVTSRSELGKVVLGKPFLMLAEAKKNNFEEGWGQCAAEMVAAQKLNDAPTLDVYGIVSDGEVWQFGKLHERDFVSNGFSLIISDIERLLGAVDFILENVEKQLLQAR